jgi:hypothetical protein
LKFKRPPGKPPLIDTACVPSDFGQRLVSGARHDLLGTGTGVCPPYRKRLAQPVRRALRQASRISPMARLMWINSAAATGHGKFKISSSSEYRPTPSATR